MYNICDRIQKPVIKNSSYPRSIIMKNVIKKNKCDGIVGYNIVPTEEEMKKGY